MTITSKFSGQCKRCGSPIAKGQTIDWSRGTGARCVSCVSREMPAGPKATGSSYTRFNSGAEVFTNRRGRCEDAPCCGCCS